ncbi:MAG: hypothetical protein JO023_10475 [Chloroflexi bacterium]|nr:hypothetical protein [Chloroflexota bacterium]
MEHLPSRFERRRDEDPFTRRDETLAFEQASSWSPPAWFDNVHVVLFEPTDPVNIGVVLRAMGNTGFGRLRLANPSRFDPWDVIGVAHYTQHILEPAPILADLPTAVADLQLVIGLTGKHHRLWRNALVFSDALERVARAAEDGQQVGLVFGREDTGLTNAALDSCHYVTTIPTNPAYPSLNLAQAALLVLYPLFIRAGGGQQTLRPPRRRRQPVTSAELERLFADAERALEAIGYLRSRARTSTLRALRMVIYRAQVDAHEAALLRSMALEVRHFVERCRPSD